MYLKDVLYSCVNVRSEFSVYQCCNLLLRDFSDPWIWHVDKTTCMFFHEVHAIGSLEVRSWEVSKAIAVCFRIRTPHSDRERRHGLLKSKVYHEAHD